MQAQLTKIKDIRIAVVSVNLSDLLIQSSRLVFKVNVYGATLGEILLLSIYMYFGEVLSFIVE